MRLKGLRPSAVATASALLCLAVLAAGGAGGANPEPGDRTAAAAEDGWRSLFNGKDLEGWTAVGTAKWRVEDGVIFGGQDGDPSRAGLLATNEKFKDFELKLDFMIDEHGKYNSGVYLRNDAGTANRTGYQVNIGRGEAGEYAGGLFTDRWLGTGDERDTIRKRRTGTPSTSSPAAATSKSL